MDQPAYGTLAVRGPFGDAQGLPDLGLRQAERQSAQLEDLGELLDLVQIDPVDHVVGGLVDRRLVCNENSDATTPWSRLARRRKRASVRRHPLRKNKCGNLPRREPFNSPTDQASFIFD